jgi:uncharacterized protein (DUF2147 family)
MSKKETLFFTLYSLSFLLFFFLFLYVLAWQEPTQNPPLSNVPAPINVSSISQIKSGRLGIMTDGIDTNYGLTVGNSSNPFGIKSSGNSYFERDLTILGNIILKDSSNNLDSLLSQGIIKEKFLPYCKQEITSDVYTNSQNQQTGCNFGGYTGYYDISNLTPENVKAGVTFGRGQVGSYGGGGPCTFNTFLKVVTWNRGGNGAPLYSRSLTSTSDGAYVTAGYGFYSGGYTQTIISKFDSSFRPSWVKRILSGSGLTRLVIQTQDGGYLLAGSGGLVIKTDSSGNPLWAKNFSIGSYGPNIGSLQRTLDNNYLIGGSVTDISTAFYLILKIDSSGNVALARRINGIMNNSQTAKNFIQQTSDGGYIITGSNFSSAPPYDIIVAKLDSSGNLSWAKKIDIGNNDRAYSIAQTLDGGYIIGGTVLLSNQYQLLFLKLDSLGNVSWAKSYYFDGSPPYISNIRQTSDGGYIMASRDYPGKSAFVIKLNSSGNLSWAKKITMAQPWDISGTDLFISEALDGNYLLLGDIIGPGNWITSFIAKFDFSGNIGDNCGVVTSVSSNATILSPTVSSISLNVTSPSVAATNLSVQVSTDAYSLFSLDGCYR